MKKFLFVSLLLLGLNLKAQVPVVLPNNPNENQTKIALNKSDLLVSWKTDNEDDCQLVFNLDNDKPLFRTIAIGKNGNFKPISSNVDPVFLLNVGSRTLTAEKGWTIFFDKVPTRPYTSHVLNIKKTQVVITKKGKRTNIRLGDVSAPNFEGYLELTIYNGVPLFNMSAVISTQKDSTAILYDAGLIADKPFKISFANTDGKIVEAPTLEDKSSNIAVKFRAVMSQGEGGSLAVFPSPHQYFYPLDEAFNLKSVWYGSNYRKMVPRYGMGIRHDPDGDRRYVPWFNAPPGSKQRLNFFCHLTNGQSNQLLKEVKMFTHNDEYIPLKGYKTMASHFHNEFINNYVLSNKPVPSDPEFVKVFKDMGVDIVHLGEFHYPAHQKGPDEARLYELNALFEQCKRLSDEDFLLLPGEEPNEFLGGHWMALFPKPVYWIMANKDNKPFLSNQSDFGKVYRLKDENDMLKLLELEKGLAWTAHPRIKGSTGYPDKYKNKDFFKSNYFLGGAWKPMPADLSIPRLGTRVLNLLDDMNNWGSKKKIIAEADLFTITKENEMYAHMNINYLKLNSLPKFSEGWQPVLNSLSTGEFFSSTGEVLIPSFSVNGKESGETLQLNTDKEAKLSVQVDWTFPMNFIEIITGDGTSVFHERIDLSDTSAFGSKTFKHSLNLKGKKWVRVEAWDIAANGAFTQTIYISN